MRFVPAIFWDAGKVRNSGHLDEFNRSGGYSGLGTYSQTRGLRRLAVVGDESWSPRRSALRVSKPVTPRLPCWNARNIPFNTAPQACQRWGFFRWPRQYQEITVFMFAIIGILVVVGAVMGGYLMEHGNIKVLIQPAELVIIGGASLGTVLIAILFIFLRPLPAVCRSFHRIEVH